MVKKCETCKNNEICFRSYTLCEGKLDITPYYEPDTKTISENKTIELGQERYAELIAKEKYFEEFRETTKKSQEIADRAIKQSNESSKLTETAQAQYAFIYNNHQNMLKNKWFKLFNTIFAWTW